MYDAFISYSHRADRVTAPTLQKGLENLNRRWLGRRRLRIFRDETDLSVAPSLWGVIQQALTNSRFFILLASPDAAASKWVAQEVTQWVATKSKNTLLLVVTSGNYQWDDSRRDFDPAASSAIPPALLGVFSEEPLLLDLRGVELHGHRRADSQAAIATLAAPIHGRSKEELLGLEVQLFRRRMMLMGRRTARHRHPGCWFPLAKRAGAASKGHRARPKRPCASAVVGGAIHAGARPTAGVHGILARGGCVGA